MESPEFEFLPSVRMELGIEVELWENKKIFVCAPESVA